MCTYSGELCELARLSCCVHVVKSVVAAARMQAGGSMAYSCTVDAPVAAASATTEMLTHYRDVLRHAVLCFCSEHGTIVHTGDWKIDENPVDGEAFDRTTFDLLSESHRLFYSSTVTITPQMYSCMLNYVSPACQC